MIDIRKNLAAGTRLNRWPAPGLTAVLAVSMLAGACGDPDEEEGPRACEQVKVLTSADLNGGVTLAADCYSVNTLVTVSDGLLKLEPGVSITFGADAGLSFSGSGSLSAVGTPTSKIFLIGSEEKRGHWRGLHFNGSNSPNNALEQVVLSHAGSGKWHGGEISRGGIFVQGAGNRLYISHSTFSHNAQAGLVVDSGGVDFKLADSAFNDNEAPLWLHANLLGKLSALTFEDNTNAYIRTGLGVESVDAAQTWAAFSVPYRATNALSLKAVLTLSPGVTIEFVQGKGLEVSGEGRLTARGTAEAPITFTGTEKQRGFWQGLYFYQSKSSANALEHVVVEYAGSTKWHGGDSQAGVFVRDNGVALSIKQSVFRENAVAGLYADKGGAELSVEGSTFENNALPVWIASNLVGNLAADNTFSDNDASYVRASVGGTTGGREVTASQTWAAFSVPYRAAQTVLVQGDLTLAPGVRFEFAQGEGLQVDGGTLNADATGGDRIVFTAADGETVRGYWKGIAFIGTLSSKNVISNADILYGGGARWHGGADSQAGVFLRGGTGLNSSLSLTDVKIEGSGKYGVFVEAGSSVDLCDDVAFNNNAGVDAAGPGGNACAT